MVAHFQNIDIDAQDPAVAPATVYVPQTAYTRWGKRAVDVSLVLLSAPLVLPVVAVMALMVMLGGQSPFFLQQRIGRGGTVFTIVKLRTMVPGADALLERYLADNQIARQEWETTQKLKFDPRVTAMGRVLRKTSLDELPQLWNVLIGDMALVGPRPILPSQRGMYPGHAYFCIRPGITGPWQVSARNNCKFRGRAKYDAAYAANLSLRTDMLLLLRTVKTVLRGTGY